MAGTDFTRAESDALASLEDRILRAVQLVNQLRQEKAALEKNADSALAELRAENERLKEEMETLRADRTQVRNRIEKLLGQLDSLAT
jgi:FtsZ-binding cell division protein ZapB